VSRNSTTARRCWQCFRQCLKNVYIRKKFKLSIESFVSWRASQFEFFCASLKNEQPVLTERYLALHEREKFDRCLMDQHWTMLSFYENMMRSNLLTGVMFLTQLCSNAWISVVRIVWVITNCWFINDMFTRWWNWNGIALERVWGSYMCSCSE
jgi:hypothetical protein